MAMKRVDDFDGISEADVVEFSIDGQFYEIDLSEENKKKLFEDFDPYIQVARQTSGPARATRRARVTRVPSGQNPSDLNAIREWARSKGKKVSDRGRIPRDIVEAFEAEHSAAPLFSG